MRNYFNINSFDFDYPEDQIAHSPAFPKSRAKLLKINSGESSHFFIKDLPDILSEPTLILFNDVKVFPARIFLNRQTGGEIELLLLKKIGLSNEYEALIKPKRRIEEGEILRFNNECILEIFECKKSIKTVKVRFLNEKYLEWLNKFGKIPLPPYIKGNDINYMQYQTIFADKPLAAAAPTAGLHFDEDLMEQIRNKGHDLHFVTLAVGLGTFSPIEVPDIRDHSIHSEWFEMPVETALALNLARKQNKKVLCVGTTSLRVLESSFDGNIVVPGCGETDIYLHPGNPPKYGADLLTNFHLPRTSLLALVASMLPSWKEVYLEAISNGYRLFSFGDAMLIQN